MIYFFCHIGTLTNLPDPDPPKSSSTDATTADSESTQEAPHAQLSLKIILPLISVILLTLLGTMLIIANVYKARKDKKKPTNPLETLT